MSYWREQKTKQSEESMSSINRVMLLGRLTRDVEAKNLPSGSMVASFAVATSESWRDKATGEKQEKTEYSTVSVFGKQAENCAKYLSKGKQVFVEGKLQTDSYEKDGVKRYSTKIVASNVTFLGGSNNTNTDNNTPQADTSFTSDNIPF